MVVLPTFQYTRHKASSDSGKVQNKQEVISMEKKVVIILYWKITMMSYKQNDLQAAFWSVSRL